MKSLSILMVLTTLFFHNSLFGIESPEKFFGFKMGTDKKLAHYSKIEKYFVKVGKESPKVKTVMMGKTTMKRDMVMAIISSEDTIKNLDRYRTITRKLSMGEVGFEEARKLSKEGKPVVFITCNLHSTEIGSSQMAVEILHKMATEKSEQVDHILNKTIFILVPSANPDGQAMVVDWYRKNRGTKHEGGRMPWLYHWYAGHDNNRDWYKINLKETWNITRQMYHNWFPQIHVDEHQMGSSGDRFFVPPYADPPTPEVHPLVWRSVNLLGSRISMDLEKRDYKGVAARGYFQGWWIGAMDDTAWFHNIAGVLFEAASVKIATPIFVEPEEVRSGESRDNIKMMFSPNPWQGGWWRLRDIVDYGLHSTLSVLKHAANYGEEYLMNSWKMAMDSIKAGKNEEPFAYVIPKKQMDPLTADKFVKTLLKSNIEVLELEKAVQTGNYYFEKGSYVIPLSQPYRAFVKSIMGIQRYPDLRRNPGDTPVRPYDGAGWTLHYAMGVKTLEVDKEFKGDMVKLKLDSFKPENFKEPAGEFIVLNPQVNNSFAAVMELLKRGVKVWRNYRDDSLQKGAFVVKKSEASDFLKSFSGEMDLIVESGKNLKLENYSLLKNIKVGLYQSWGSNMIEGWTRYVFDEFKVNYDTVRPADVLKKGFVKRYDVLIFVNEHKSIISKGKYSGSYNRYSSGFPRQYKNGIGKRGQKVLEEFLGMGKTIIFTGRSWEYAAEKFKLPVINVLKKGKGFFCPGSYLKAKFKESELTFGMPAEGAVYISRNPVFSTRLPGVELKRSTPVVMGMGDFLMSGYLKGEELLKRRSLVVDFARKSGRIILIGPDLIHRAQTEGTYKIMFNSILTGAAVKRVK